MLIYVGMTLGRPEPIAYLIAHVLKVLGGTVGGFVARVVTSAISEPRPV